MGLNNPRNISRSDSRNTIRRHTDAGPGARGYSSGTSNVATLYEVTTTETQEPELPPEGPVEEALQRMITEVTSPPDSIKTDATTYSHSDDRSTIILAKMIEKEKQKGRGNNTRHTPYIVSEVTNHSRHLDKHKSDFMTPHAKQALHLALMQRYPLQSFKC